MEEIKQCPYCGKEIKAIAKKCKHCGEWLTNEDSDVQDSTIEKVDEPEEENPLSSQAIPSDNTSEASKDTQGKSSKNKFAILGILAFIGFAIYMTGSSRNGKRVMGKPY